MSEVEFVDGLIAKAPHDNAPEFVKAKLSIKRADLGNWLRAKDDEWININIKEAKSGKWYAEVDTWKPESKQPSEHEQQKANGYQPQPEMNDDIPFR